MIVLPLFVPWKKMKNIWGVIKFLFVDHNCLYPEKLDKTSHKWLNEPLYLLFLKAVHFWPASSLQDPGYFVGTFFVVFIVSFSHLSLFALTIDRYIFIKRPLHYPLIMTPTKTWIMVLAVFMGAFFIALVAVLGSQVTYE